MTPVEVVEPSPTEAQPATDLGPTIPIAELFGPTLQGEGQLAGKPTYFLRVGGCDYACVWCDSSHAVLPEEVRQLERLTQAQINAQLLGWVEGHPGPEWLTISGGNPALYDLSEVVAFWQASHEKYDYGKVAVETQGSRFQPWLADVDLLTISPKPPSSQMPTRGKTSFETLQVFMGTLQEYRYNSPNHNWYMATTQGQNEVLKVVVFDDADYEFARQVHRAYPLVPFYLSTGTAMGGLSGRWVPPAIPVRPEGYVDQFSQQRDHPIVNGLYQWSLGSYVDKPWHLLTRYRWLAERAMTDPDMADVAVFPQLHALIWGIETRGV